MDKDIACDVWSAMANTCAPLLRFFWRNSLAVQTYNCLYRGLACTTDQLCNQLAEAAAMGHDTPFIASTLFDQAHCFTYIVAILDEVVQRRNMEPPRSHGLVIIVCSVKGVPMQRYALNPQEHAVWGFIDRSMRCHLFTDWHAAHTKLPDLSPGWD